MNLSNGKVTIEYPTVATTVTQKEAIAMYVDGHVYHRSDTRENANGSTRWHCQMFRKENLKCPVKLKLGSNNEVLKF